MAKKVAMVLANNFEDSEAIDPKNHLESLGADVVTIGEVRRLHNDEKLGPAAIARRLGIARASVYRVLGKHAVGGANGGDSADQG